MIILHGRYYLGLRKTGARKDFCNGCERECLSELWQSFDWVYIFWIPLLPLGSRERWLCTLCHKDPRARYKTSRLVKIAGLFATAFFLVAMVLVNPKPDEVSFIWGARAFFAFAFLGLLYAVLKPKPTITEDEHRKGVIPLSGDNCVYCRAPLAYQPHLHCPTCQIRIYT